MREGIHSGAECRGGVPISGLWRSPKGGGPYQPHPGTRVNCCGCSLPGLTGFTIYRCEGTDTGHHYSKKTIRFYSGVDYPDLSSSGQQLSASKSVKCTL